MSLAMPIPTAAQRASAAPHPPLHELLPPVVPVRSAPAQRRLQSKSNRFKKQQSLAAMMGGILFTAFLLFGMVQVGRALVENVSDLVKLSSEANYIEHAHQQSLAQRQEFLSRIDFYQSTQGTESLIRNYLNATYPDEILVTLQ